MFNNKLHLKEEIGRSWLIQRLEKPREEMNPFSFGGGLKDGGFSKKARNIFKGIWSFDYMGSSEFEWGAVPQALSFLLVQSKKKNMVAETIKTKDGEEVYFIAPDTYKKGVIERIKELRKGEVHLKEHCGLKEYFDRDDAYSKRTLGWLELDNGFAFFVDKTMFENFSKLIGVEIK